MTFNHGNIFHEISELTSHNLKTSIPLLEPLNINYSIKPLNISLKLNNFPCFTLYLCIIAFKRCHIMLFGVNAKCDCENHNITFSKFLRRDTIACSINLQFAKCDHVLFKCFDQKIVVGISPRIPFRDF